MLRILDEFSNHFRLIEEGPSYLIVGCVYRTVLPLQSVDIQRLHYV